MADSGTSEQEAKPAFMLANTLNKPSHTITGSSGSSVPESDHSHGDKEGSKGSQHGNPSQEMSSIANLDSVITGLGGSRDSKAGVMDNEKDSSIVQEDEPTRPAAKITDIQSVISGSDGADAPELAPLKDDGASNGEGDHAFTTASPDGGRNLKAKVEGEKAETDTAGGQSYTSNTTDTYPDDFNASGMINMKGLAHIGPDSEMAATQDYTPQPSTTNNPKTTVSQDLPAGARSILPIHTATKSSTPLNEAEPILAAGSLATEPLTKPSQAQTDSSIPTGIPSAPGNVENPTEAAPEDLLATDDSTRSNDGEHSFGPDSSPPLYAFSDTDSALGSMSYASSVTSATDSIYESIEEHGRTYHSYKRGKYTLPNDVAEQERLDMQHIMMCTAIDGRLFLAPLDPLKVNRVLDIATGTGIWPTEFADDFPKVEVVGTDLTPIQPRWCPPNCRFEVDDAEDDWVYTQPFSYIHGRALLSCFADPLDVIRKCFNALEPGGWCEWQDATIPFEYEDGPAQVVPGSDAVPELAMQRWEKLTVEASIAGGRPWNNVQHYKRWFEEVGFEDVVEYKQKLPIGVWKGLSRKEKKLGAMQVTNFYRGIEGMSLQNFKRIGWEPERTKELCAEVRKEMKVGKTKPYNYILVVYGRKPSPNSSSAGNAEGN